MTNDEFQARVERFWQDKARGLLLGQACADGLAVSFGRAVARAPVNFDDHIAGDQPLRHTAATELALGVAECLSNHQTIRHVDGALLQTYLAHTWWADKQRCGYGLDDTRLFTAVLDKRDRPEAAVPREGAHPAVPVAPLALTTLSGPDLLSAARMCAGQLTQDPLAHAAAAMFASAVATSLAGGPAHTAPRLLVSRLRGASGPHGVPAVTTLQQLAAENPSPSEAGRELLAETLGATGPVAAAVYAFLRHPDHPREAIRYAVHLHGSPPTIAAMTGALAGARHGVRALPTNWRKRLARADSIEALADRLAQRHSGLQSTLVRQR